MRQTTIAALLLVVGACAPAPRDEGATRSRDLDPLPSNVPPAERIAVLDNDGTLSSERPAFPGGR